AAPVEASRRMIMSTSLPLLLPLPTWARFLVGAGRRRKPTVAAPMALRLQRTTASFGASGLIDRHEAHRLARPTQGDNERMGHLFQENFRWAARARAGSVLAVGRAEL